MIGILDRVRAASRQLFSPSDDIPESSSGLSLMGGTRSRVVVNETSAMGLSAYWCACRTISEDMMSARFRAFIEQDGEPESVDSPAVDLLMKRPNDEETASSFVELLTFHALSWGNGYAEIQRNGFGEPVALHPIEPWRVFVLRDSKTRQRVYRVWGDNGSVELGARDVFHLRGPGGDRLVGWSVARIAAESIGVGLAAERFGASFFGNGANAGSVYIHPSKLSPEAADRIREAIDKKNAGPENAHRTLVLEEGIKWVQTSIPPEDAQFLETRGFSATEMARWFRMPPHKLGDLSKATFSNIEEQSTDYVRGTLSPWGLRLAGEATLKLTVGDERIEADLSAQQLADIETRFNAYRTARDGGWLSVNEIRRFEGRKPIGPAGDTYLVPLNHAVVTAGSEAPSEGGEAPSSDGRVVSLVSKLIDQACSRLAAREAKALARICRREESERAKEVDEFVSQTGSLAAAEFARIAEAAAEITGKASARDLVMNAVGDHLAAIKVEHDGSEAQNRSVALAGSLLSIITAGMEGDSNE